MNSKKSFNKYNSLTEEELKLIIEVSKQNKKIQVDKKNIIHCKLREWVLLYSEYDMKEDKYFLQINSKGRELVENYADLFCWQ